MSTSTANATIADTTDYFSLKSNDAKAKEYAELILDGISANDTPVEFYKSIVDLVPASISSKVAWYSDNAINTIEHLKVVCQVVKFYDTIDFEDTFYGKLYAPADVVYIDDGVVYLADVTADDSLTDIKTEALNSKIMSLEKLMPGVIFKSIVYGFPHGDIGYTYNRICDSRVNKFVQFKIDYAMALRSSNISDEFMDIVKNAVVEETKKHSFNTYPAIESADKVALGSLFESDLLPVLEAIKIRYPIAYKKLSSFLIEDLPFSKGLAPPMHFTSDQKNEDEFNFFGKKDFGRFLQIARDSEDGDIVAWSEDKGTFFINNSAFVIGLIEDNPYDIALKRIGPNEFKYSISESANGNLIDFYNRSSYSDYKEFNVTMSEENIISKFLYLENELTKLTNGNFTDIPDATDRASAVLNSVEHIGDVNNTSKNMASKVLDICKSTISSKILSMARIVHGLAIIPTSSNGNFVLKITSDASGRIIQMTKKTGTLGERHTTVTVVAVSRPINFIGTWEFSRNNTSLVSKALIINYDKCDWYSEAPGAVAALTAAYYDTSDCDDNEIYHFSSAASLLSVSARRSYNVMISQERYTTSAAVSFASEFQGNIEKMNSVCMVGIEQLIAARIVIRASAACLVRDTGSLKNIVKVSSDGTKSIFITPSLALRGSVSPVGNANSFYYSKLCPCVYTNRVSAEVVAFKDVMVGTKTVNDWRLNNDERAWGSCKEVVYAWEKGYLDDYINSADYIENESNYVKELMIKKDKYCSSIAMMYFAAKTYGASINWDDILYSSSNTSSASVLSTKKAFDLEKLDKRNTRDYAFLINVKPIMNISVEGDVTAYNLNKVLKCDNSSCSASVGSMSVRCSDSVDEFSVYVTVKNDTVEKMRDISLMNVTFRYGQLFIETSMKAVGSNMQHSALHYADKMPVLSSIESSIVRGEKNIIAKLASDISTYGPGKDPISLLTTIVGLGAPINFVNYLVGYFKKLAVKRVYLSDSIIEAGYDKIKNIDEDVADLLNTEKSIISTVGMMQGLMTYTADVQSATVMKVIEDVTNLAIGNSIYRSTNDDGAAVIKVPINEVRDSAVRIAVCNTMVGAAFAEIRNLSKLHVTTFMANLNTNLQFSGSPVLPYVRSCLSCASTTSEASTKGSFLEAMSKSNQACSEGAPLFVLFTVLAFSYSAHFEKFRIIDKVVKKEYPSKNCLTLGPPIFYPTISFTFGALPTIACFWNVNGTLKEKISALATSMMPSEVLLNSVNWDVSNTDELEAYVMTEYINNTHPASRESKEVRLKMIENNMSINQMIDTIAYPTVASVIVDSLSVVSSSITENPYKPTSTLYAHASTAFAIDNRRIIAHTKDGATKNLNLEEFYEEIKMDIDVGSTKNIPVVCDIIATTAENASRAIASINGASRIRVYEVRKYTVHKDEIDWRTMVDSRKVAIYAMSIFPDESPAMRALYMAKGMLFDGDMDFEANYSKTSVLIESSSRAVTKCIWKGHGKVLMPSKVSGDSVSVSVMVATSNIGRKLFSDNVDIERGVSAKNVFLQEESDIIDMITDQTYATIAKVLEFKHPIFGTRGDIVDNSVSLRYDDAGLIDPSSVLKENKLMFIKTCCAYNSPKVKIDTLINTIFDSGSPAILRRYGLGQAAARERKIKLYDGDNVIKYIACRLRHDNNGNYLYKAFVYVRRPDRINKVSRMSGSNLYESEVSFNSLGVGFAKLQDMIVEIRKIPSDVVFRIDLLPPAFCMMTDEAVIPLEDVRGFHTRSALSYVDTTQERVELADDVKNAGTYVIEAAIDLLKLVQSNEGLCKSISSACISRKLTDISCDLFDTLISRKNMKELTDTTKSAYNNERDKLKAVFVALTPGYIRAYDRGIWSVVVQSSFDSKTIRRAVEELPRIGGERETKKARIDLVAFMNAQPSKDEDESEVDVAGDFGLEDEALKETELIGSGTAPYTNRDVNECIKLSIIANYQEDIAKNIDANNAIGCFEAISRVKYADANAIDFFTVLYDNWYVNMNIILSARDVMFVTKVKEKITSSASRNYTLSHVLDSGIKVFKASFYKEE